MGAGCDVGGREGGLLEGSGAVGECAGIAEEVPAVAVIEVVGSGAKKKFFAVDALGGFRIFRDNGEISINSAVSLPSLCLILVYILGDKSEAVFEPVPGLEWCGCL